jgi:hypothetical protein
MAADSTVYMTVVTLEATAGAVNRNLDSATVQDAIWGAAVPGDGLEHVYATADGDQLRIVSFMMAAAAGDAEWAAVVLCERASRDSPLLSGWIVRRAG